MLLGTEKNIDCDEIKQKMKPTWQYMKLSDMYPCGDGIPYDDSMSISFFNINEVDQKLLTDFYKSEVYNYQNSVVAENQCNLM